MGWVAVACCALIAGAYLFRWINTNKFTNTTDARSTSRPSSEAVDTIKATIVRSRSPDTRVVTLTQPTVKIETPKTPGFQVDAPTARQRVPSEGGVRKTTMMAPPPPPNTSARGSIAASPRSQSPPRLKPPSFGAPPRPGGGALRPPPSAASSLRVPVTKVLSNTSMAPSSLMPPPKKKSRQVTLEPGHSPLDWAALTSNPIHDLRGKDAPPNLVRITPSQLKTQNGRKGTDSWTVYQGKVYNITPYVPFHPGGKGEILRGAGKDSAKLFNEVHPWVNWDGMLKECMVGILVSEDEAKVENTLDEMD